MLPQRPQERMLCLVQLLVTPHPLAPGHITPVAASLAPGLLWASVSRLLPLLGTLVTGCSAHLDEPGWPHREILRLITSAKTLLFQYGPVTASRWTCLLGAIIRPAASCSEKSCVVINSPAPALPPATWLPLPRPSPQASWVPPCLGSFLPPQLSVPGQAGLWDRVPCRTLTPGQASQ